MSENPLNIKEINFIGRNKNPTRLLNVTIIPGRTLERLFTMETLGRQRNVLYNYVYEHTQRRCNINTYQFVLSRMERPPECHTATARLIINVIFPENAHLSTSCFLRDELNVPHLRVVSSPSLPPSFSLTNYPSLAAHNLW